MNDADGELGGNEPGATDTWNFSIKVAKGWEETFFSIPTPLTRKIAIRSVLTLSPARGGVFDVLLGLIRRCLEGRQGSGWGEGRLTMPHKSSRAINRSIARTKSAS